LAGIIPVGSNMNNPSQEIYSEVPSMVDSPIGGPGTSGYAELGGEGPSDPEDVGEIDPISKIRQEAEAGAESPEGAQAALTNILALLDDFEKMNSEEETNDFE